MLTLIYDGSFAGLLSTVFAIYEYRHNDVIILPDTQRQESLFGETQSVPTEDIKADRVWKGLQQRLSPIALQQIKNTYLSEQKDLENNILQYIQYAFSTKASIESDFCHPAVLYISNTARKVHREKHRMEAFVRFRQTQDNIFFATIEPDFNVLPLIADHFERRYADQQWLIYDTKRKYGLFYDLHKTTMVSISFNKDASDHSTMFSIDEDQYAHLWKHYFTSTNIPARKNLKLHIQHMPKRYWKFLTEKQPYR